MHSVEHIPADWLERAAWAAHCGERLIVDYAGKRLELSGLTDAEREFADPMARQWASNNPGTDAPCWVEGKHFRKGQAVTFKFRELSDDGIPKEASYWRRRDAE